MVAGVGSRFNDHDDDGPLHAPQCRGPDFCPDRLLAIPSEDHGNEAAEQREPSTDEPVNGEVPVDADVRGERRFDLETRVPVWMNHKSLIELTCWASWLH